jgi:hypothetical protein
MNITRFTFCILLAAFVSAVGCAQKPALDPLAGWQKAYKEEPNQTVEKDYQDYIQKLSPEEKQNLGPYPATFFKDGTGQHAVRIKIGINGNVWEHILIYDKDDKRIKTIKYISGGYAS